MSNGPTPEGSVPTEEGLRVVLRPGRSLPNEGHWEGAETGRRRELRDPTGLALLVGLVLVVCALTVGGSIVYIAWLQDAAPAIRIDRLGQILVTLVGALVGAISTLLFYFYRRSK
jgi:hypothetical protein